MAAGIITGAFGAHALKSRQGVTTDNVHAWETASHYAVSHLSFLILPVPHGPSPLHLSAWVDDKWTRNDARLRASQIRPP